MSLEIFPNEILIQCFEYLDGIDILHSFNDLNYRFNEFIRSIPLYLNFINIRKSIFDQVYIILKSNPEIKTQIYSIKLSNINTCHQIKLFLSFFSLDEFLHLRSLTLSNVQKNEVEKLKLMLPFLSELDTLNINSSLDGKNIDLHSLQLSQLRKLTIPTIHAFFSMENKLLLIRNLTVWNSSLIELHEIFKYTPLLEYLHVYNVYIDNKLWNRFINYYAVRLKQLIMNNLKSDFVVLKTFLKKIPNLRYLTISANDNRDIIDASYWEDLITTSLTYLQTFKFKFSCFCSTMDKTIIEIFKQFQTNFWQKDHHWYTEYEIDFHRAVIYTIPYISKQFELRSNIKTINKNCNYQLSKITSLIINDELLDRYLKQEDIESLRTMINLWNIKHITFSQYSEIKTPKVIVEILKQTPQLSSMKINLSELIIFFDDEQLCEYFNRMIKKLDLHRTSSYSFIHSKKLAKFCQIFVNIEQLICEIYQFNDLLYILNHLPKLSILKVYARLYMQYEYYSSRLQTEAKKHNIMFDIEHNHKTEYIVQIWTG